MALSSRCDPFSVAPGRSARARQTGRGNGGMVAQSHVGIAAANSVQRDSARSQTKS